MGMRAEADYNSQRQAVKGPEFVEPVYIYDRSEPNLASVLALVELKMESVDRGLKSSLNLQYGNTASCPIPTQNGSQIFCLTFWPVRRVGMDPKPEIVSGLRTSYLKHFHLFFTSRLAQTEKAFLLVPMPVVKSARHCVLQSGLQRAFAAVGIQLPE